jgi:hypothetical protein
MTRNNVIQALILYTTSIEVGKGEDGIGRDAIVTCRIMAAQ